MPTAAESLVLATPVWAAIPFGGYLLLVATLPLFFARFWQRERNKLLLALGAGVPVVAYLLTRPDGLGLLGDTLGEYVAFISLLGALFVVSGGIYLRGSPTSTSAVNTLYLAVGALAANLIGTTGASALLIRPLLRANQTRPRATHVMVFFIFIVSNSGGMLTPLGDPPLFLGFLRGVPFTWTLRLFPQWAVANGILLLLFYLLDRLAHRREDEAGVRPATPQQRLAVEGGLNALWLLGIGLTVFAAGTWGPTLIASGHLRLGLQVLCLWSLTGLSLLTTPRRIHEANRFSWAPLAEVAAVFIGIFVTMVPALLVLEERGASLGVTRPWQFFWASGLLSSLLDNAPTYLTFASLATGVVDEGAGLMSVAHLGALAAHPVGSQLLAAVACGSVLMGANTYIGNGPNFMVKAIAEQHGVRMPSFLGYTLWSGAILLPLFVLMTWLFF